MQERDLVAATYYNTRDDLLTDAASLGLDGEIGTLHPGKRADMAVLDLESYRALGYQMGGNRVVMTVVGGEPVMVNTHDPSAIDMES